MSTIRKGIETFLQNRKDHSPFLIPLWSTDLESQFLVHPWSVEVQEGAKCWTDGEEEWAAHRWPYKAGSDPYYKDKPLKFNPASHISRVGSTWWNWKTKRSVAVAFDIDMEDDGHASTTNTVTEKQLDGVVGRLKEIQLSDQLAARASMSTSSSVKGSRQKQGTTMSTRRLH